VVVVMAVVVDLEVVVVVMMAVMEVDAVVGVVAEDAAVVVSEIEVVEVEDSEVVGVVVGANVVATEVVVAAVMEVATEVVDMGVDTEEVVSKADTEEVATEDKATTRVDTVPQQPQRNQHTIRTEVQVARTQPEVVVATVHNRKPRQPEVTLKEAATQDRPTPRTTGVTEVNKVTANRVVLREATNKEAMQVRPTGRVTAAHHNNQQHQHLQVTLKGTTNNNNNNPHTEVQVVEGRTDTSSKLDVVVSFSHEERLVTMRGYS